MSFKSGLLKRFLHTYENVLFILQLLIKIQDKFTRESIR